MTGRPELLDNLSGGITHRQGLSYLLDDFPNEHDLSIATGYVNLGGLHHIAVTVADQRRVRLLLGASPAPGLGGGGLPIQQFERGLLGLQKDRDLARFPPSRGARRLIQLDGWLRRPNIQVRRYVNEFLHGKAYLFGNARDARAALVTSANLTSAGLDRNRELGLVNYGVSVTRNALAWFDNLWKEAVDYKDDLLGLLFPDPGLIDPQDIYLRALLELFGEEDLSLQTAPGRVNLADFQLDGFARAMNIVKKHHGVIYADGVGTGKTEIGLAFIEEYAVKQGHPALVVAPRQLVEYWRERIDRARLPAQVITYFELAHDEQLADRDAPNVERRLHNDKDTYRLVLVDEGHALRNPGNTWHRAMVRMMGGERKDLVLLTATPINNGLWDMFHLVMTFAQHDSAFAGQGIRSLRKLFERAGANAVDARNLNPDVLFPLADMVSVRRDRRYIETRHPDARFPDGAPVRFPEPRLATERYDLDEAHPHLVRQITDRIDQMTMARYSPSRYRLAESDEPDQQEKWREASLGGLLKSAILKRFESCWAACLNTVHMMIGVHRAFLDAWDLGVVPSRESLREARDIMRDDESGLAEWLEDAVESEEAEPAASFEAVYREKAAEDLDHLEAIRRLLSSIGPESDPKLALLRRILEESPSEKVIVFSTFADTIRYLDEHLPETVGGRRRVTVIGMDTDPDQRTRALGRFCPETVVRPGYRPPGGEVDLLLCNDVLAEGQNLQQAAAAVSYDMPWNPQRVVQRYGRVVRLRSPHDQVHLTTMLPEKGELEKMLELESSIRRKVYAAGPYGMEIEVIEGVDRQVKTYTQRLEEGDRSLLDDPDAGAAFEAFSGELLRAEIRRAVREGEIERIRELPWGAGAAFRQHPDAPSQGPPGFFFACRIDDEKGERYWRYVTENSLTADDPEAQPATILRRIDPGNAPKAEDSGIDLGFSLEDAWNRAADSIVREHNESAEQEDANIGPVQQWALQVLNDPAVPVPPNADRVNKALSIGRGNMVRRELGAVKRSLEGGEIGNAEAARRIAETVEAFGLRPVDPPPALTPITKDNIGVVCWMAVLPPS